MTLDLIHPHQLCQQGYLYCASHTRCTACCHNCCHWWGRGSSTTLEPQNQFSHLLQALMGYLSPARATIRQVRGSQVSHVQGSQHTCVIIPAMPAFLNVAVGKCFRSLPVGEGERAFFPHLYHHAADEGGSIRYAPLIPSGVIHLCPW